jgi:predicted ATPase/DNA-binding SARP family transcriptional activator
VTGGLDVALLGPLEVRLAGVPVAIPRGKPRALLALLVLHRDKVVSLDRIVDGLWGETPPPSARHLVHVYVSQLRHALGPDGKAVVVTQSPGYLFAGGAGSRDIDRFQSRLDSGTAALEDRRFNEAAEMLAQGLALWRGPALADVADAPFANVEVERLEELQLIALERRIDADLGLGQDSELGAELQQLVQRYPTRERLRAQQMLALYRSGRQADALEAFREARRVLVDELGIEPDDELRRLERAILRQDATLKLEEPSFDEGGGPGVRPLVDTPLIGRERELAEIAAMLQHHRVVTVTGPGGCGKTRLASEVAGASTAPDGVFWVSLQTVRESALVLPTIAAALGAENGLAERVADRAMLIILDNFEHVADAAPDVAQLSSSHPGLRLLMTSRERLRLRAEREYALAPLSEGPAVELFRERAEAADARFSAEAEVMLKICRRLDSLPLAIELAAARVKALPAPTLLARLDDRLSVLTSRTRDVPERHRSLTATIQWSDELLDAGERRLFRTLAVFAGGWTLEAAEEVCSAELETLESLVDKSLVRREGDRFSMLETIREYAGSQLTAAGDLDQTADHHLAHFLAYAEAAFPATSPTGPIRGAALEEYIAMIDAERDNLHGALMWALSRPQENERALRLAVALNPFWIRRSEYLHQALGWFGDLLRRRSELPPQFRAQALESAGRAAVYAGRGSSFRALLEEARDLFGAAGDERGVANVLADLGFVALHEGDFARAEEAFEGALEWFAKNPGEPAIYRMIQNLGELALDRGNLDRALDLFVQSAEDAHIAGDRVWHASAIHGQADVYLERSRFERADELYGQALAAYRSLRYPRGIASSLGGLAVTTAHLGDPATAGLLWGGVCAFEDRSHLRVIAGSARERYEGRLPRGDVRFETAANRGRALALEDVAARAAEGRRLHDISASRRRPRARSEHTPGARADLEQV